VLEPEVQKRHHQLEWELLLACGAVSSSATNAGRLRHLCRQVLDWEWLLQASRCHGMVPLLYQALHRAGQDLVPDGAWQQLEELYRQSTLRALWLTSELLRCLDLLANHDLPAIPFKGPVLAATAYGDVSLRQYADLDIWVRQGDARRARDLLVSHGYHHHLQLNDAQEAAFLRAQAAYALTRHREYPLLLELHWRFFEAYFSAPLASSQMRDRSLTASLLGRKVRSLRPEDTLLMLCVHATKHVWTRLGWVCDIARLVQGHPHLDWPAVLEQARGTGCLRMLHLGLDLAQHLFQAPLPPEVVATLAGDKAVVTLARQVCDWQRQQPHAISDASMFRFHLRARERTSDRLRYVVRLVLTPTVGDWQAIRLPSSLYPLYYLLRPLRLMADIIGKLHRPTATL